MTALLAPLPAAAQRDLVDLEPFVDGVVTSHMAQQRIAGVQLAVVKDGRTLLIKGYGLANIAPERRVDPERSLFRLASISKTFTWIALMQLEERGKLRLEDPVNAHLPPELAVPDDGWDEPIRILDLMNHTAGFEENGSAGEPPDDAQLRPASAALREERPQRVRRPGQLFSYSNYGVQLAGAAIAHVSGMDFETYVERHVFAPLAMEHTTFREPYGPRAPRGLPAPMAKALVPDIAQALTWKSGAWEALPYGHVLDAAPAASVSSTASDMTRYMIALLDPPALERAGVLTAATWARMKQESFRPAPGLRGMHHGFFNPAPGARSVLGHATLAHGGNMAHFESFMSLVPELGLGIFITTNSATGVMLSRVLQEHILSRYFLPAARPPARVKLGSLSEYTGDYRDPRRSFTRLQALFGIDDLRTFEEGSQQCLQIRMPGDDSPCFMPIGRDLFQKLGGDARIAFLRGPDGAITNVVGAINGERVRVFDTGAWLRGWLVAGLLVSLGTLWMALRRHASAVVQGAWQRRAAWCMTAAASAWLAFFIVCGAWQLRHADAALEGYPQPLVFLGLGFLLPALSLTVAAAALLPAIWRGAQWSLARRAWHSAALLVWLALGMTLHHWNVIGFRF